MKHLVLGSEGQIGKYVCDHIESLGGEVIRWDLALDVWHDLSNPNHMFGFRQKLEECDFVHFLAYNVGGSKYLAQHQNSYEYIAHNSNLMFNVFEQLWFTKKPFYFASSQMSNMTDSVYGQLKAIGESYTKALGGINVKFWNVYGYESDPEKSHVITDFIKMMFEDGRIICRTDGQEKRHFTYARDAARMLYDVALNFEAYLDYAKDPRLFYTNRYECVDIVNPEEPWYKMTDVAESVIRNYWRYKGEDDWRDRKYPCFFSRSRDTTQTLKNDWYMHRLLPTYNLTRLEDGIAEMVQLIGKDYG